MKKIACFLLVCTLLCGNVFAADNYTIVDMSEFAAVDKFSEGLCAVQDSVTMRWGFVDVNKNWVISPQYKTASYFKNGLCAVNTLDGESILINRGGEIVFRRQENSSKPESDNFFIEKHGIYRIINENMVNRTLVDENYKSILPENIQLRAFISRTDRSHEESKTIFWEDTQKKVFNYKGIDITDKLTAENIELSDDLTVSNKYIVGYADGKNKCFDIDGNKVAEFNGGALLSGDMLIGNNSVYNIADNKKIFDGESISVEKITPYYNKCFTIKKKNGTSALYSAKGKILADFGKWDYIYPSSASNNMVVSVNGKYGIADYDGNLLLPLEYGLHFTPGIITSKDVITSDGKYSKLAKDKNYFYLNMSTLKQYYCDRSFVVGYKYHVSLKSILDNNLNVVYVSDKAFTEQYLDDNFYDEGRMKISNDTNPLTYGFLIFDDGGVKVKLDGNRLEFDVLPVVINGRTLVPMRTIFEALGAEVEWDGATQSITVTNKDVTVKMQIDNNALIKNGQNVEMDVCPQLIDGRTMVPVRAISECFNVLVDWDGYSQTVSLFTN